MIPAPELLPRQFVTGEVYKDPKTRVDSGLDSLRRNNNRIIESLGRYFWSICDRVVLSSRLIFHKKDRSWLNTSMSL